MVIYTSNRVTEQLLKQTLNPISLGSLLALVGLHGLCMLMSCKASCDVGHERAGDRR